MKKNLTELVFILDKSGSMSGLETDTIGGFNSLIEKQKRENVDGETYVSVVLFNQEQQVVYDRVSLQKVEPMTEQQYFVGGSTALLDAVGGAIRHMERVQWYAREEERPDKVLFVITTDGYENSSRRYSYDSVKRMIEQEKEKHNWEFLFLGANIDAVEVAGRFGIAPNRASNYHSDRVGTRLNYEVLSKTICRARKTEDADDMACAIGDDWDKEIEQDFKRR